MPAVGFEPTIPAADLRLRLRGHRNGLFGATGCREWEVDGTGSGSCPEISYSINSAESSEFC